MAGIVVEVIGLNEILNAIDNMGPVFTEAAAIASQKEAEYELPLTKEQVPVDTRNLYWSGRVEPESSEGDVVTSAIVYGGPAGSGTGQLKDVDYALIVHEDLSMNHPRGGKAKYVEDPVRAEFASGRAAGRMAETILSLTGGFATREGLWVRGAGGKFTGSTRGIGVQG